MLGFIGEALRIYQLVSMVSCLLIDCSLVILVYLMFIFVIFHNKWFKLFVVWHECQQICNISDLLSISSQKIMITIYDHTTQYINQNKDDHKDNLKMKIILYLLLKRKYNFKVRNETKYEV